MSKNTLTKAIAFTLSGSDLRALAPTQAAARAEITRRAKKRAAKKAQVTPVAVVAPAPAEQSRKTTPAQLKALAKGRAVRDANRDARKAQAQASAQAKITQAQDMSEGWGLYEWTENGLVAVAQG